MKELDLFELLKNWGWSSFKDDVGDMVFYKAIGDKNIHLIPSLKEFRSGGWVLELSPSVSLDEFDKIYSIIGGDDSRLVSISKMLKRHAKIDNICIDYIKGEVEDVVAWADGLFIFSELERLENLPTNAKGSKPLLHLTALAFNGRAEKLEFYLRSFDAGDRLEFVNYITRETINRALSIALKRQHGSKI